MICARTKSKNRSNLKCNIINTTYVHLENKSAIQRISKPFLTIFQLSTGRLVLCEPSGRVLRVEVEFLHRAMMSHSMKNAVKVSSHRNVGRLAHNVWAVKRKKRFLTRKMSESYELTFLFCILCKYSQYDAFIYLHMYSFIGCTYENPNFISR